MWVDDDKCAELGCDVKKVASVARRLSKAAKEANVMGLKVFGGSGSGSLRVFNRGANGDVAILDGVFDGGDGGDNY